MNSNDKIYRRSVWAHFPLFAFLLFACVFLGVAGFRGGGVIVWMIFALNAGIAFLVGQRMVVLLGSSNWVLRLAEGNLTINCSALGRTDGGSIAIPLSSIMSARRITEQRRTSSKDSAEGVTETHVYLELTLEFINTDRIKAASTPVVIIDDHTFRVAWCDHTTRLTPSIESIIGALPNRTIRETDQSSQWIPADRLAKDKFENRIRELCAGNDKFGAIALMRERYGLSLTDAVNQIEDICRSSDNRLEE